MKACAPLLALLVAALLTPAASAQQRIACQGGSVQADGMTFACDAVDFYARVSLDELGSTGGNDIWGWTDPVTGKEYALVGMQNGTAFVDVSEPAAPVVVGRLPTQTVGSVWRDIKVYADHAFVVADAAGPHGMQVFDLTRLRDVTSPPVTFAPDAVYTGIASAHNVAINEATGFAYVVGASYGDGGPPPGCPVTDARGHHAVDVRDPQNPTLAGCFSDASAEDSGYTHDTQCVVYAGPDSNYQGREICFGSNTNTVTIFDATDKANAVMISQAVYPNVGYTHQGWLTEDHRYFIANDEADESNFQFNTRTLVFDVSDLDEPAFVDGFFHPVASIDHNLYVKGRYVYASNYSSGLRVLDLQPLLDGSGFLMPAGHFDTYPQNDGRNFEGSWSNYPYFESGIVIVNDRANGLFVLALAGGGPTDAEPAAPGTAARLSAHPNPFQGRTRVVLSVGRTQAVTVAVYDALGRRVAELYRGPLAAGEERSLTLDAAGLPAGLYLVRAVGETFAETRAVSLLR